MELNDCIKAFLPYENFEISDIDNGLINHTYKIETSDKKYILQRINTSIFKQPEAIIENHLSINSVLEKSDYSYQLLKLVPKKSGEFLFDDKEGNKWRMTEFLDESITFLKVPSSEIAFKAAKCFSEFYAKSNTQKIELRETLPGFINFKKRTDDFLDAIESGSKSRKQIAVQEIEFLKSQIHLVDQWLELEAQNLLPKRVIHADPKISNLLFDLQNEPLAVIDLDTLMNATLLYDFGDMVRSYCNLTNEDDDTNEDNFSKEIYEAVKKGFLLHLKSILSPTEIENLDYAAKVVVYIQAVRFLTDFLNGDVYYSVKWENHNLHRTRNQMYLLKSLLK